jgi:DNA-binding winged helix-turn-helix (wHTH) protein
VLLENPGEVISREELRNRLWSQDTFVDFEGSLRVAVGKLRQALDDNAEDPRYIETVPKRGYRFLVPEVRRVEAAQEALALCDDALRDDLEPLKTGPSPPMRIDFVDCWNWGWFCQRDSRGYLRMGFQGKRRTNGRNLGR